MRKRTRQPETGTSGEFYCLLKHQSLCSVIRRIWTLIGLEYLRPPELETMLQTPILWIEDVYCHSFFQFAVWLRTIPLNTNWLSFDIYESLYQQRRLLKNSSFIILQRLHVRMTPLKSGLAALQKAQPPADRHFHQTSTWSFLVATQHRILPTSRNWTLNLLTPTIVRECFNFCNITHQHSLSKIP